MKSTIGMHLDVSKVGVDFPNTPALMKAIYGKEVTVHIPSQVPEGYKKFQLHHDAYTQGFILALGYPEKVETGLAEGEGVLASHAYVLSSNDTSRPSGTKPMVYGLDNAEEEASPLFTTEITIPGFGDPTPEQLASATIKKTFNYHKPSEVGLARITEIRKAFSMVHNIITELAPKSRELSVALTELETAAMWAIKAVVVNDPDSVVNE